MMRRLLLSLLLAAPAVAGAQPPVADSGVYARARRLVSDGEGAAGRAVVDSLLAAATAGTPAYAEALYWRATFAERSADAEQDYRRLAVDYAFSPRAADALLRLAQLDLVRGRGPEARDHLDRLLRDHPDAATQARGRYWLARLHLAAGEPRSACAALDSAASQAAPGSEVARQVAALRPRVANCETFIARRPSAPAASAPTNVPATAPTTTPAATPAPTTAPATTPATTPAAPRGARQFTVQIAAYDTRPGADALAASLERRGYPARVVAPNGDRPPFRVRIGRYATRDEAAAMLRELRGRRIAGFLTDAEP